MNERDIFIEAVRKKDAPDRRAYLDQACVDDGNLRHRVDILLQVHERAGNFLEPVVPVLANTLEMPQFTEHLGTVIGPYKLVEQIGEGGFGVVYLAEQQKPVRRRVALKIIKPGMDTRQVIARFEAERQALALMNHPNIAHVLDAGTTDSGRPYFVMELVKGIPITGYCDQCNLTTRDRLELFVLVCQAVQHAHQKGIIHRDIKPSNVLVTLNDGRPTPKVIDFGVAKAINQRLTDATAYTQFAQMVGTPLYMSPEQAGMSPLDVDTRSDIYSLGVLLYELLTGTTPFEKERLKEAGYDELRRILREEEPPKPSQRLSTVGQLVTTIAEQRRIDPRRLSQLVRGDLDWIVMKALEKDPTRRYQTASAFAADVQRYLDDDPIEARPPSALYKFRKFARRNRAVLVTTGLVAVALVVGTAVSVWQAVRATRNQDLATRNEDLAAAEQGRAEANLDLSLKALDAVYLEVIDRDKLLGPAASQRPSSRPKLSPLERDLLKRGLSFYEKFAQQNHGTPRVRAQTALAYYRAGLLHGALGDGPSAEAAYRVAIERLDQLAREQPDNPDAFRQLADAYSGLADVLPEWPAAKAALVNARTALTRALALRPQGSELYLERGVIAGGLLDFDGACADFEKALELGADNATSLANASNIARFAYRRAVRVAQRLAERAVQLAPDDPHCHLALADVLLSGRGHGLTVVLEPEPALKHFARAIELAPTLPAAFRDRASLYLQVGDFDRAMADLNRAVELAPADSATLGLQTKVYIAQERYQEALAALAQTASRDPRDPRDPTDWSVDKMTGDVRMLMGQYPEAVSAYTNALQRNPSASRVAKRRAYCFFELGNYRHALADLKMSMDINPQDTSALWWIPPDRWQECPDDTFRQDMLLLAEQAVKRSPTPANAYSSRGELYSKLNEYQRADEDFATGAASDSRNSSVWGDRSVWNSWGNSYMQRGLHAEALTKYSKAIELDSGDFFSWQGRGIAHLYLGAADAALADFNAGVQLAPYYPSVRLWRANAYKTLGRRTEAVADLSRSLELKPTRFNDRYLSAVLSLQLDDPRKYREICARTLQVPAGVIDPTRLDFAAWICALAPGAVDDYSKPIALAKKAVETKHKSDQFLNTLGAILYRGGQHQEALSQLSKLDGRLQVPKPKMLGDISPAYTWYFLAMTHHAVGNAAKSRELLKKANDWAGRELQEKEKQNGPVWNRRETLKLLRQEAEALVQSSMDNRPAQKKEAKPDSKPLPPPQPRPAQVTAGKK